MGRGESCSASAVEADYFSGLLGRKVRSVRTAYLGVLNYAAPCLEGPVWGSRAAAMVILADRPVRAEHAYEAKTNVRGGKPSDGTAAWRAQRNRESGQSRSARRGDHMLGLSGHGTVPRITRRSGGE